MSDEQQGQETPAQVYQRWRMSHGLRQQQARQDDSLPSEQPTNIQGAEVGTPLSPAEAYKRHRAQGLNTTLTSKTGELWKKGFQGKRG